MVLETDDNKYRPPCEADLDVVRELVFLREMEHKTFCNREVQRDPKVIRKFIEELSQYQHDLTDKNDAELKERLKEALAPRINKLVKNPGVLW